MRIHVVGRGDSLWRIARDYGASINQLVALNELPDVNRLLVGQAILVPDPYREYVVQRGDTLWEIAQRFGVELQELIARNRLSAPYTIVPGQVIVIPVIYHTVRAGESLWSIARQYGTTAQAIAQSNRIANPALIAPNQVLRIPEKPRPEIDVNAYLIAFGETGAQQVRENGSELTFFAPFGYRIQADGGLGPVDDGPMIAAGLAERVVPMMSITNFSATDPGSRLAQTILESGDLQDRLLANVIDTMKAKGYRGLNIDFENVYPSDREPYNRFLQRAVDRLHPEGYFVSSALAPKTSGTQQGLLYEAHDYPAHGRILDFVVLMTYEWGYRLGPPQAISPLNQIKRVLDYAVSVIPRDKIFMGFQLYARDWRLPHVRGQQAETFSMQEAVRRAVDNGVVIQYDPVAESPFYRYTDNQGKQHEVWFEDARSAQAKFDTVKQYGLRGISYWVLGYPFPQNWVLLEDNFRIRKRM